jgi:pimeloyl-ACP methyl ester carboxylesterase
MPAYDVHIIDLPGFGVEPLISREWGIPEYAAYAEGKIAALQLPSYVLVGHSFGGRLAAVIASKHRSGLEAIILYAAPCLYIPRLHVRVRNALARTAKNLGIAQYLPTRWKPYDVREADATGMGDIFRRSVPYSLDRELTEIAVPTKLVWGSLDRSVPLFVAEEMKKKIPHSTLTVLPGEGHNIHLDNPTLLYGTLNKLLTDC